MRERKKKNEEKEREEEKEEKKTRRKGSNLQRKFLWQAVQSSGFPRAGKGPKKLTKQKKLECFTCRVRHPGEGLSHFTGLSPCELTR